MTLMPRTFQNQCDSQMVTRQGTVERVAKNYWEDAEGRAYINSSGDCESKEAVPTVRWESSWGASDGPRRESPKPGCEEGL